MRAFTWLTLLLPALALAAPPEPGPPSAVEGPTAQSPHLVSELRFDTQVVSFKDLGHTSDSVYPGRIYRFGIGGSVRLGPVALDLDVHLHVGEHSHITDMENVKLAVRLALMELVPRRWFRFRLGWAPRVSFPTDTRATDPYDPYGLPSAWQELLPLVLDVSLGPVTFSTNQGPLFVQYTSDVLFPHTRPIFWYSQYGISITPHWRISIGVGVETLFGLNRDAYAGGDNQQDVVWLTPSITIRPLSWQRFDLGARIELFDAPGSYGDLPQPIRQLSWIGDWAIGLRYAIEFPAWPRLGPRALVTR